MDSKLIAKLVKIAMKLEDDHDFVLSDKVDKFLKSAQYAGQFDRVDPYTEGLFGTQISGTSPTAFGPYQGPGNDKPFISDLDPMTVMKLQHTKGSRPGSSAFLDALEKIKLEEQQYRISPMTPLRLLAVQIKTMASDPARRGNYFAKELDLNIEQTFKSMIRGKVDANKIDEALESFYKELEIFNSKNQKDLIPIEEVKGIIERYKTKFF